MSELAREQPQNFRGNPPRRQEVPFKVRADQFIESVPENGRLFDREEMRSPTLRETSYLNITDSLKILLRAYGQLDKSQQEAITVRIQTIINGSKLVNEKMAERVVPELIRLAEVHIPKDHRPAGGWRASGFEKRKWN